MTLKRPKNKNIEQYTVNRKETIKTLRREKNKKKRKILKKQKIIDKISKNSSAIV